ncbi:MAG TPA: ABC transporter ATP-binding protein/permease [Caulobacteraceae bacterium]|nr:ABC transporter ATP-binding protein/permease [Caulobacteraceae bacterium]
MRTFIRPDAGPAVQPASLTEQFKAFRSLGPYLWPKGEPTLKLRVLVALALILGGKLLAVAVPLQLKRAVDALTPHAGLVMVLPIGIIVAYGLARVGSQAANELRELAFARVAQRAVRRVALKTLRHLHALSLRFHLDRQTGGLSRLVERGTAAIEVLLGLALFNLVPTLLEITLVSAILWRFYDPAFAGTIIATLVAYGVFTATVTQWRVKLRREMIQQDAKANSIAIDSLLNYETVKYFGAEAHEAARFDGAKQAFEGAAVKSQSTLSLLNIGQNLIMSLGLVVIMVMAARGVQAGRMTVGDFVMVNGYLLQLYMPLNMLGVVYRNLKQALVDFEQMHRLLSEPPEVQDPPGEPALRDPAGAVTFEQVSFAYEPRRKILDDVSFEIPPGRKVAIVGSSGAGKSTVARLLFRFYDPTAGRIAIGGQDLRQMTQDSLRRAIGVVPQDTVLFNDTIYYNILYGRPDADRDEVEEAARLAHLHDFVAALPDGYETRVGERGLKLSGGEKQRVAIARVLLKRPRILIFDEATSALDTRTEQHIQAGIREVSVGHTTLVIAHRLSTVIDADEILVMEGGRIAERGGHEALLAKGGVYAAMWARQQRATDTPDETVEAQAPAPLEDAAEADDDYALAEPLSP